MRHGSRRCCAIWAPSCQILYISSEHGPDVGLKPGLAAARALASRRWQIIKHSVDDYLPKIRMVIEILFVPAQFRASPSPTLAANSPDAVWRISIDVNYGRAFPAPHCTSFRNKNQQSSSCWLGMCSFTPEISWHSADTPKKIIDASLGPYTLVLHLAEAAVSLAVFVANLCAKKHRCLKVCRKFRVVHRE